MSKLYTVYHTEPLTGVKKEVGFVLERRENNFEDLMKEARELYPPLSPGIVITLENGVPKVRRGPSLFPQS